MLDIETEGLTKRYSNDIAIEGVSLRVEPATAFGLLGANGAGKTSTLSILTTAATPTAGRARVTGLDVVTEADAVRRRIGVVQDTEQPPLPHWTPVDYVTFFARLQGVPKNLARQRAQDALTRAGLAQHLGRRLEQFSSGMKKKVELVRALVHEPKVLFLDEPTKQLDIVARGEFWQVLRSLREGGKTLFIASHDPAEIASLCTHVGVLSRGRLLYQGSIREFAGSPSPQASDVQAAMQAILARRTEFSVVQEARGRQV